MGFELRKYIAPDFTEEMFGSAPDAVLQPAPADRVAPQGYHAMSIFPEYFKIDGKWLLAEESRMDCVPVYENGKIAVREFRLLKQGDRTLVIDAKYYAHTTQKQYDVNTLHSGNLYQIFTYVKNLDTGNTGNVSGLLLYAKTDELVLPNNNYKMGGNAISVKTLDLDCDFAEIRKQLDDIVGSCFETI